MSKWQKEAEELQHFYQNLEILVKQRTKELEEAHKKEISHEKEIQKLKDQFVFIAAHELRTPVTAISWGLENAIESGKETLDKTTLETLQNVQKSNSRLIDLIDDLLNVARIDAGTIKIEKKEIDIESIIEETIKEMNSLFKSKNVKVSFDKKGIDKINTDPNRLKQVLINLLTNATKYNKENGSIDITISKEDDYYQISVKDTGIGIKEEDMDKLFKKFSRIQDKKTQDVEGTGLGLFVTKEIVSKLGGKIDAESKYNEGSTFRFTLPI